MTGSIEIYRDTIAEKLDEMADLSLHWKRNREKGIDPNAIRSAMIMLAHEVTAIVKAQEKEDAAIMDHRFGSVTFDTEHSI